MFQLAPRMADRFAAASMMAGHPNETRPDGLRNLPFSIWMGGKDAAYDRNRIAGEWETKLASLRAEDPGGYEHRVAIFPEFGHWMNGEDRAALPWMTGFTRDPWPRRVVWLQDDVTHRRFYWLEVPADAAAAGVRIVAEVAGQAVTVTAPADRVKTLTLRLSDTLLDLDRPVRVVVNGAEVHDAVVPRTRAAIEASLATRPDPAAVATAAVTVPVAP